MSPNVFFKFTTYLSLIALVLFFLNCSKTPAEDSPLPNNVGPGAWSANNSSPVFTKQNTLQEGAAIGSPSVVIVNSGINQLNTFVMAYAQGGTDTVGRIGMAASADGVTWNRVNSSGTILSPSNSGWDSHFLDTPCLLKQGGIWYLWYFGATSNSTPGGQIGLATSSDGINFTKYSGNPVLSFGGTNSWEQLWVESPAVAYDGARFVMYYTGVNASWLVQIGRATSPDGIHWTKEPTNPVLGPGSVNAWDSYASGVPDVIYMNNQWQLYFAGVSTASVNSGFLKPQLGLAQSNDGIHFTRDIKNPIITTTLTNDQPNGPYNPTALFDSSRNLYFLWYESGLGFGLVTAP